MRALRLLPALALAALSACDSSEPVGPTADVDAALTLMATGGISSYTTAAAAASVGGATVPVPAASAASCPYDATTKFFVCAPVAANGMTFSRKFQLLDASGSPLATANALSVASIRSVVDLEGTITQGAPNPATIQLDRHEDATLTGIQSASRLLNGTSTQQMTLTSSGFSLSSNETGSTSNLQLPSNPDQKYPLGGTITATGSMTLASVTTSTQQYSREISFDGSSIMTVKMTASGSTTTCKVNLASPGATPTCS
jgi:hypothetical protein